MSKKILGYLMQLPLVILLIAGMVYSPPAFAKTMLILIFAIVIVVSAIKGMDLIADDAEERK